MRMSQSCVVACGGTVPKIMSLFHVTRKFQSLERPRRLCDDREGHANFKNVGTDGKGGRYESAH